VNQSLLAIVGALTLLMLIIFLATGQELSLTVTAVLVTGGLGVGAAYFYAREEGAGEPFDEEPEDDEAVEAEVAMEGEKPQAG
jgi:hypothetical protein